VPRQATYVRDRSLVLPVVLAGAGSPESGRRVRGREAIACNAEGALDALWVLLTPI